MSKSTVVIRGGQVVNPDGIVKADVRISDGVIDAVGQNLDGEIVVDATDAYVY